MTDTPTPEIVHADARHRRLVLFAAVAMTAGAVVVFWWLDHRLDAIDRLAKNNLPAAAEKARSLVSAVILSVGLSFTALGLWLFRLGLLINRSGQYPPPGMKVIRNTLLRTGSRARIVANAALIGSLLTVLAGTVGMWYVLRLAHSLLQVR